MSRNIRVDERIYREICHRKTMLEGLSGKRVTMNQALRSLLREHKRLR